MSAAQEETKSGIGTRWGHFVAFAKVVPAADYAIRTTQSQGSACCEYAFWLRDGQ